MGRRFDEAIVQAERALEIDPAYPIGLIRKGLACALSGRHADGVGALQRARGAAPDLPVCVALLGYAYGHAGDRLEAQRCLDELRRQSASRYVPAFLYANIHAGLGEHDEAVRCMEREHEVRGWYLVLLRQAPQFDSLRAHEGFQALVRRMRFPSGANGPGC